MAAVKSGPAHASAAAVGTTDLHKLQTVHQYRQYSSTFSMAIQLVQQHSSMAASDTFKWQLDLSIGCCRTLLGCGSVSETLLNQQEVQECT
jgi:hypothetical protein